MQTRIAKKEKENDAEASAVAQLIERQSKVEGSTPGTIRRIRCLHFRVLLVASPSSFGKRVAYGTYRL
jgi:hypothetical protein